MNIVKQENSVSICKGDKECDMLDAFVDIWVDDGNHTSPFKTLEDAELFAEILIKLMGAICDDIE